jgi:positive phototaxis protein PixI
LNLTSNIQANRSIPAIDSIERNQQQFLKFAIQPGLMAIVEIECVMELVNIPLDRVVPMPHLPPAVRGVYNWRGEILWIVDLAMLLGVSAGERYRKIQPTIVLSSADRVEIGKSKQQLPARAAATDLAPQQTIGFIVDEIIEIELCQLDLSSGSLPEHLNPELAQSIRGVWESPTGEDFLVLDESAILDRANVHADARSDLNYFFR